MSHISKSTAVPVPSVTTPVVPPHVLVVKRVHDAFEARDTLGKINEIKMGVRELKAQIENLERAKRDQDIELLRYIIDSDLIAAGVLTINYRRLETVISRNIYPAYNNEP